MCLLKIVDLYTKMENFIVCKLNLNEFDLKRKKKSSIHKGAYEEAREEENHESVVLEGRKNKVSRREWSKSVKCYRVVKITLKKAYWI